MELENVLEEKTIEFNEASKKVKGMLEASPKMISSAYEQLKDTERNFSARAKALSIPFNLQIPNKNIDEFIIKINENISKLQSRVEAMIGISFENPEDAIKAAEQMQDYGARAKSVNAAQNQLFNQVTEYQRRASFSEQKGIDEKVQAIIKKVKLQLLNIKIDDLKKTKISFFGRIRGLDKLRDIQLENLNLEKQILDATPIQVKTSYNVQDSLADLRAFSISELGGRRNS